jgi:hypothetical protein
LELGRARYVWNELSDFANLRKCKLSFANDQPDSSNVDVSLPHLEELTLTGIPNLDLCALVAKLNAPALQVLTLFIGDPTPCILKLSFDFMALKERSTSFYYLHTVSITFPWLLSDTEELLKVAPNLLKLSLNATVGGLWYNLETWAEAEKKERTVWSPRLSRIHLSSECRDGYVPELETFLRYLIDAIQQGGPEDGPAKLQVEVKRDDFKGVSTAAWSRLQDLEGDGSRFELKVLD